jgi:hypothetical protein
VLEFKIGGGEWHDLERRLLSEGFLYSQFVETQLNVSKVLFRIDGKILKTFSGETVTCGEINIYAKNLLRMMKLEAI